MFTYYQGYLPEVWKGYAKRGLIDSHTGIRFCQNVMLTGDKKFNELAAKDGALWKLEEENHYPFYIDRLQGGCYFDPYPYDMKLINEWRELLGEKFLGFQMHEWMSNLSGDFGKIRRGECREWTVEGISAAVRRVYPFPNLFLEAAGAEELAKWGDPANYEEFLALSEKLFARRMKQTDGLLIPCDSGAMALQLELSAGVKTFMPEVGWQIAHTRYQISYARGMARAHSVPFGAYYEPWGGAPFSTCNCHRDGFNEWGITKDGDFPFESKGEYGGSSRSLQKRIHVYAYFAGASYMAEEWGVANTFYDFHDFELSPYGRIKKEFFDLVNKYPEVGETYTPVGIILPKELSALQDFTAPSEWMLGYELSADLAKKTETVQAGLKALCEDTKTATVGTENRPIDNSLLPDAFDILHEDKPEALSRYEYLIDLTGKDNLSKKYRCIRPEEAEAILRKTMPCFAEGGVHWFVNRIKDGWYLIILNNDGVCRSVSDGEKTLPEGAHTVTVTLKDGELRGLEGVTPVKTGEKQYTFTVPAGEWFLGRF